MFAKTKCQFVKSGSVAALCLLLHGLTACHSPVAPPSSTLDTVAQRYVALVTQLGEHDPDSLDFSLAPATSTAPFRILPDTLAGLQQGAESLAQDLASISPGSDAALDRKQMLDAQIHAVLRRSHELVGQTATFDAESELYFGVIAPGDTDARNRDLLRSRIARELGHPPLASLASAYSLLDAGFIVPRERVPAVMQLALEQCRTITAQHMPLPPGQQVRVEYVVHKPWSAFSRYLGHAQSLIQLNMDFPETVDRLLDLACHEGYPGHHVFNSVRDSVAQRVARPEWSVQPTFSPQSFVSEAAASFAPELVPDTDRLRIEQTLLCPAAGIRCSRIDRYLAVQRLVAQLHTVEPVIAREYLDGRLEFVRAAQALERDTLMEHGETMLLYLNEYRTYMLTYTLGRDKVRQFVDAGSPPEAIRWQRYRSLMENLSIRLPEAQGGQPGAHDHIRLHLTSR